MRRSRVLSSALLLSTCVAAAAELPQEVSFPSADGQTRLRAYLFEPSAPPPWPAVVMLHGRSGPYSTAARGVYQASTLSQRHLQWGRFWAERGYLALHVDSFGPRGYPEGFPLGSYSRRPAEVNEQTVRPLDAYGAAAYLRTRGDVVAARIGLQGWSNGAMAGLATLATPPVAGPFRAALLFYPGCRIQTRSEYRPYAPALMFVAAEDEEVSAATCATLAEQVRLRGIGHFQMVWYPGATHAFDDPGARRQAVTANRAAREDSLERAARFFELHLRQ